MWGEKHVDVLRTKGLVRRVDGREYLLQGVTDIFELKEVPVDKGGEMIGGKVVFIGRNVDLLKEKLLLYISS